jgi:glycosyltransferase involved in cell wall biosynthesis
MRSSSIRVLTVAHNAVADSNRARARALGKLAGVEVKLLTPPWWFEEGRRVDARGGPGWTIGRTLLTGNSTRYVFATGLGRAIRGARPDVIDLFEEPFSLVALQTLALRALLAPDAAVVFYSAVNVMRRWRWPYRTIEALSLRLADGAHTPNADAGRILRRKGLSTDKPVQVIPLGVDAPQFGRAEAMPLPHIERPRIGFVGRFEPVKGLDVLLDAVRRMRTRATLVLAGDGSERQRLTGDGVHVLQPIAYDQLPSFLKSLDVLVLPSVTILPLHCEQFGRVLVEAMAAGVPVVGSSSGAIPEVIGDAGLVVPERDATALAHALDLVLTDSDTRVRLIERGHQRVATRFAWPVIAEQSLELFHAALAHRRGIRHPEAVLA